MTTIDTPELESPVAAPPKVVDGDYRFPLANGRVVLRVHAPELGRGAVRAHLPDGGTLSVEEWLEYCRLVEAVDPIGSAAKRKRGPGA